MYFLVTYYLEPEAYLLLKSVATISTIFLMMVKYPKVQESVQHELDAVLSGRLPTFKDREDLPYLNATIKEAMRFHPAVPLGIYYLAPLFEWMRH